MINGASIGINRPGFLVEVLTPFDKASVDLEDIISLSFEDNTIGFINLYYDFERIKDLSRRFMPGNIITRINVI